MACCDGKQRQTSEATDHEPVIGHHTKGIRRLACVQVALGTFHLVVELVDFILTLTNGQFYQNSPGTIARVIVWSVFIATGALGLRLPWTDAVSARRRACRLKALTISSSILAGLLFTVLIAGSLCFSTRNGGSDFCTIMNYLGYQAIPLKFHTLSLLCTAALTSLIVYGAECVLFTVNAYLVYTRTRNREAGGAGPPAVDLAQATLRRSEEDQLDRVLLESSVANEECFDMVTSDYSARPIGAPPEYTSMASLPVELAPGPSEKPPAHDGLFDSSETLLLRDGGVYVAT